MSVEANVLLLLAGGRSQRMGVPKGLLSLNGRPFFAWQLQRFFAAGGRQAILVLGYDAALYEAALAQVALPQASMPQLFVTHNPQPEFGPFSSIQQGWRCAEAKLGSCLGAFVLPIDVPAPSPEVWQSLAATSSAAALPRYGERGGHPVRLKREVMELVVQSAAESRLDQLLARLDPRLVEQVPVTDAAVRRNLNTPQDWAEFAGDQAASCSG